MAPPRYPAVWRFWLVTTGRGNYVALGNIDDLRSRIVETNTHPAPWTVTDLILEDP